MVTESKNKIKNWHTLRIAEVLGKLKTDKDQGLTDAEVEKRLKAWGRNRLPEGKKAGPVKMLLRQFTSPLVYILLAAALLTFLLKEFIDMSVILLVVAVNTGIGFYQEYRADRIFEELKKIVKVKTLVVRGGRIHTVDSEELVPGDVVVLKGGAKVPADARIVSSVGIKVNEAILTGESSPVSKQTSPVRADASTTEQNNLVFMGTSVEQGEARAVVTGTGANTEIGKLTRLTQMTAAETTPLQTRVKRLGRFISELVTSVTAGLFIVGLLLGYGFVEMVTTSIAVAVAAIPEGLPAAISVILAVSAQRILKRKGLIRRLVAAETLGSTSVIATDKTGTLTYGVMRVEKVFTEDEEQNELAMALANEAVTERKDGELATVGESTDKAKLEYFLRATNYESGTNIRKNEKLIEELPRIGLLPFDPDRKYIASFHKDKDKLKIFVSGAPEAVIELCKLSEKRKQELKKQYEELAGQGYRVIAQATGYEITKDIRKYEKEEELIRMVREMEYAGLAAIRDPAREDVRETLRVTREAGIKVLMITGDHLLTAKAVGRELGFEDHDHSVITGAELESMSDDELTQRVGSLEIIARAEPVHKMRIIDAWQNLGAVVAMTGDGVNDAPALKSADIGVAVGSGTDVTKEAADLVLLNDSFSTITRAVREGRAGFDNIKKVTLLLMSNAFSEIILISTSLVLLLPFPVTAVQILWVNLIEGALPGLALAFERAEPGIMKRPPIKLQEKILNKESKVLIFGVGIATDIVLVGIFLYLFRHNIWSIETIRTFIFAAIGTDTLVYAFAFKSLRRPFWRAEPFNNRYLIAAFLVGLAALFGAVYLPILNRFLGTVPLGVNALVLVAALAGIKLMLVEVVKKHYNKLII